MKTVCFVFVVAFAMENFCVSAQQYTVSACKDGTLQLNCRTGLIQVDDVVLGDSTCSGSNCCPCQDDCHNVPTLNYRNQVDNICNGRSSCSTYVEIRNIGCSWKGPNNDYASITYSCIATQTSPEPTTLTTITTTNRLLHKLVDTNATRYFPQRFPARFPTTLSSSYASTVQKDQEDKDYRYLDRLTTLVAVIVGGVVITAIVISIAVVLVLKKRRTAKIEEEHYDMPNNSRNENNDDEYVRNSNSYEFIPDSANCSAGESAIVDYAAKENGYLALVMENEEAPYLLILES